MQKRIKTNAKRKVKRKNESLRMKNEEFIIRPLKRTRFTRARAGRRKRSVLGRTPRLGFGFRAPARVVATGVRHGVWAHFRGDDQPGRGGSGGIGEFPSVGRFAFPPSPAESRRTGIRAAGNAPHGSIGKTCVPTERTPCRGVFARGRSERGLPPPRPPDGCVRGHFQSMRKKCLFGVAFRKGMWHHVRVRR